GGHENESRKNYNQPVDSMTTPTLAVVAMDQLEGNPAALEALLMQVFVPDTQQIKAAEEIVKHFTKRPGAVPALMGQMRSSPHPQARQLAAMLLRKKMMHHWAGFTPAQRDEIKRALLEAVAAEPERLVRHSIAALMAKLAKALFAKGGDNAAGSGGSGWNELLAFVAQCAQHQDEAVRELAFVVLHELTETTGDALKAHFPALLQLFLVALRDPSVRVQTAALRCVAALLAYLSMEKDAMAFRDAIPLTLSVAKVCMLQNDEAAVSETLDALGEMITSPQPLLNPHVREVLAFLLEAVRNEQLEAGTRDMASHLIGLTAAHKQKLLVKSGMIRAVLETVAQLIASHRGSATNSLFAYSPGDDEDDDDDGAGSDDDGDFDGPTPQSMAQACLDAMALSLPARHVFPPCMEICRQCSASPDPNVRKAAAAIMGIIAEGCSEPVRQHLSEILPLVLQWAMDPDVLVRECAAFCLGQFSEHCQPEILEYHEQILPMVFRSLDDDADKVKGISCYVLEQFTENLPPEALTPFLDPLLQRLVRMLHAPKRSVVQMAVAAIAATAVAAEEAFLPYLDGVVALVGRMLSLTEEKAMQLRCRALECMGHIAIAVKADHFRPYLNACMQCASENLKLDNLDLHDYSYNFFANIARVLGDGMAPYMSELVPHLMAEVAMTEESPLEEAEAGGGGGELAKFAHDDEEDDEEEGQVYLNVRTAELDKRRAAVLALGALAEYVPETFNPYIAKSCPILVGKLESWHDEIRSEACDALPNLVTASVAAHRLPKPVQGEALALSPETAGVTRTVVSSLLKTAKEDTEREVVTKAIEALQAVVSSVGVVAVAGEMQAIVDLLAAIFQGKADCQGFDDEDDEEDTGRRGFHGGDADGEDDEDGRALDRPLVEAAADLVGALAQATGPQFVPYFDAVLPSLLELTRGTRTADERSFAVGALAEVVEALGGAAAHYFPTLLPTAKLALASGDASVRRNSAFLAGVLAQAAGPAVAPHAIELLQSLEPLFRPEAGAAAGGKGGNGSTAAGAEAGVVDNAASAVARLIMASPESVPLAHVLPTFLKVLPLRADQSENKSVYRCVLGLLAGGGPDVAAQLPAILDVLVAAAGPGSQVQGEMQEESVAARGRRLASEEPQVDA
ncbi:unnamed protein product, partial [Phaeothamnion confervicola]